MMHEIIQSRKSSYLHIGGFVFQKYLHNRTVRYWRCKNQGQCPTRAVSEGDDGTLSVRRHSLQDHAHAPNREEVEALHLNVFRPRLCRVLYDLEQQEPHFRPMVQLNFLSIQFYELAHLAQSI